MNYYPFINKNKSRLKEVRQGAYIYVRDLSDKRLSVNNYARDIYNCCDGKTSIQEMVDIFYDRYKSISIQKETIEEDVLNTLRSFNDYGLIAWQQKNNPFVRYESFNGIGIYEIGLGSQYMVNDSFDYDITDAKYLNGSLDLSELPQLLFLNLVKIYSIKKDDNCCGYIMLVKSDMDCIWQILKLTYTDDFCLIKDYEILMKYIFLDFKNVFQMDEFGFYMNGTADHLEQLKVMGFEERGILKDEIDEDIYSMWQIFSN